MIRSLVLLSLFTSSTLLAPRDFVQDPAAEPVTEHALLGKLAGDWSVATTFSIGPGSKPKEFRGTAHAKAILGGRFVQFDEEAVEFGQPVERQKTWGFNNASKKFESTWMYTGSTAVMRLSGTMEEHGKTIAGDAAFDGEKSAPQQFTWNLHLIDADHFSSTLVAPAHGDRPAATFTAVYTRAAKK